MLNVFKCTLFGLLILQTIGKFNADMLPENINKNASIVKEIMTETAAISLANANESEQQIMPVQNEQLKVEHMPLVVEEKDVIVKEIKQSQSEITEENEGNFNNTN